MTIKKEWIVIIVSSGLAALVALGLMRLLAPGLIGEPVDLIMVQASDEVPPFFDGVFRESDQKADDFIIKDPYLHVRAKPFLFDDAKGPTDLLGFRNRRVPTWADVITIGDSQTYGNNANLENNWPSKLANGLSAKRPVLYSMAIGGWGPVEYLEIFEKALSFRPRVVVVAVYSGNDPIDGFLRATANDRWKDLRPKGLPPDVKRPKVSYPAPKREWWTVEFKDGVMTSFTPRLRYGSNVDHPAVNAGWAMTAKAAEKMASLGAKAKAKVIFTIIPTKSTAFAQKVAAQGMEQDPHYKKLVEAEGSNIARLKKQLEALKGATYVDVIEPLQKAIMSPAQHYLRSSNGHPNPRGYDVIARTLVPEVERHLPDFPNGLYQVGRTYYLVRGGEKWRSRSLKTFKANGWSEESVRPASLRDLANIPWSSTKIKVKPARFGPGGDSE